MMYITLLALFGAALSTPLEDGLKSGEALMALFSEYNQAEGHFYTAAEAPMRLRIFRSELKSVVDTNSEDLGWFAGLNFMSDMTEEEKAQYLGLNATVLPEDEGELMPLSSTPPPSSVDWRSSGAVTPVKNQGSCGSCWAFAAIGSIEGVHKIKSGSLVTFSDQELLDCTYEGRRDGCQGGWYHDAFSLLKRTQRLASSSAAPYRGRDGRCSYGSVSNSLKTRVSGHQRVSTSESGLASALSGGPVSVAFQVTSSSQRYKSGEFRDRSCRTTPNHAVTAVGYTSTAIIIKNSWGSGWGYRGYIHFKRGHHNCGLYTNNAIISMSGRQQEQEE